MLSSLIPIPHIPFPLSKSTPLCFNRLLFENNIQHLAKSALFHVTSYVPASFLFLLMWFCSLGLNKAALYVCTTFSYPLIGRWVHRLILLLSACENGHGKHEVAVHLWMQTRTPSGTWPGAEQLEHMASLFLGSLGISRLISIYVPPTVHKIFFHVEFSNLNFSSSSSYFSSFSFSSSSF